MSQRLRPFLTAGVILLVAVVTWWVGTSANNSTTEANDTGGATTLTEVPATSGTTITTGSVAAAPAGPFSGLATIARSELPPEALDTLDDIAAGGPFDFSKDDSTFQNREGILPDRERGHYREYTVITPGSDDRGARRIVAGAEGELYYTDDHYNSFREIVG